MLNNFYYNKRSWSIFKECPVTSRSSFENIRPK